MSKSFISGIAAATLVGTIGLVYAQSGASEQDRAPASQPVTTVEPGMAATSPSSPGAEASGTSTPADSPMPPAQADRN